MGNIPKQVLDMDNEADKSLEEDATKNNSAEPIVEESKVVESKEQNNDPSQSLLKTVAEDNDNLNLQRAKSTLGRAQKIREDAERAKAESEEKLREAMAENERLRQQLEVIAKSKNTKDNSSKIDKLLEKLNSNGGEYTREDAETFLASVDTVFGDKIKGVEDKLHEIENRKVKEDENTFIQGIEQQFPGFIDMDKRGDERWVNFLNQNLPEPMNDFTYRQIATDAIKSRNTKKMTSVIREFTKQYGEDFSNKEIMDGGLVNMRPDNVSGNTPRYRENNKQIIKRSEADAFRNSYLSRRYDRYGYNAQQAAQMMKLIEEAEEEGRIDENS